MRIAIEKSVRTAVVPSEYVHQVASMFGLGIDEERTQVIVPRVELDLKPGQVVFVTGPSGSGKSTIVGLIREVLVGMPDVQTVDFHDVSGVAGGPLVDGLGAICSSLDRVLEILCLAGLGDAFVMLRSPEELSDGQRHRLRLARMMAQVEAGDSERFHVVLADEFCAALDRATACVLSRNIRKWVRRLDRENRKVCFIAVTSHDDLLESLEPDLLIEKHLGRRIDVVVRDAISV
jgi:ABC-type ATPase with predicted acetyltransferase domain